LFAENLKFAIQAIMGNVEERLPEIAECASLPGEIGHDRTQAESGQHNVLFVSISNRGLPKLEIHVTTKKPTTRRPMTLWPICKDLG